MPLPLLTAKIQRGYYLRKESLSTAYIHVSKEASEKQCKSWKRMLFFQGMPEHLVAVRSNRLEDVICLSTGLFRKVYQSAKILRGKLSYQLFQTAQKVGNKVRYGPRIGAEGIQNVVE
jgi:hypothetical protein